MEGGGGGEEHEREFYASFSNILDKMKGARDGMPFTGRKSTFAEYFTHIFPLSKGSGGYGGVGLVIVLQKPCGHYTHSAIFTKAVMV